MSRKDWTPVTIDGVSYELRRGGFMDTLKLSGLCTRVMGEPIFRALATSGSVRDLLSKLSANSGAEIAAMLDEDVDAAALAKLAAEYLPSLLDMLGDGAGLLAENLTDTTLEQIVRLAVLGKLKADTQDGRQTMTLVESTQDLDNFVQPWVEEHGIAHQLRLLWACLRHQAGPTKGGSPGSHPTPAMAAPPA